MDTVVGRPLGAGRDVSGISGAWELVAEAQAGSTDAFGELYDRYASRIFKYVMKRCGNVQTAEDLTSETFLRALRRINFVTNEGKDFSAWLTTIARNLLADHYKAGSLRFEVVVSPESLQPEGPRPLRWAGPRRVELWWRQPTDAVDARDVVWRLLPQLTDAQQRCLLLRFWHELTIAEVAQVMDMNEGAVKALSHRAIVSLRRSFDGVGAGLAAR